ncbi:diacylglycerol/lipid kinase family protein [Pseudarthrobacter sp. J1763]|uniref:diacylglycerol/lipid kinase family protein n=1 Tax=Pseudarthrobacter sp. J1763 TaxID=3420445 RepID=UPI003D2AACCC
MDPVETVASISTLVVRDVDLGLVNGRPYFGVANVGFDGLANQYGNDAKLNLGSFTYLYGGLKALREWKNVTFTVVVDGQESTFPGWFVAVGNVGQYGGGLHICPEAKVNDGLLDVVSLGEASIFRVVATFLASFRGGHLQRPGISFVRGKEIRIHANKPLSIFADGEMLGPLPATMTIEQASVRVLVPGNSSVFQ